MAGCGVDEVVVVKVGGSSLTQKDVRETLDQGQLQWLATTLAASLDDSFRATAGSSSTNKANNNHNNSSSQQNHTDDSQQQCRQPSTAFVIIHGAGSYGHHHAKEYSLSSSGSSSSSSSTSQSRPDGYDTSQQARYRMEGLTKTRLSVQRLNRLVLEALLEAGINAVGISPCFAAPSMHADSPTEGAAANDLRSVVESSLRAGLVPVLHGDACLRPSNGGGTTEVGILSGDTLFAMLALAPWVTRGVFLTDVDGVYTADPYRVPTATLIPTIGVPADAAEALVLSGDDDMSDTGLQASESRHDHDVTGGFRTKLAAALDVVRGAAGAGTNVTIARCGSESAAQVLRQAGPATGPSTLLYRL